MEGYKVQQDELRLGGEIGSKIYIVPTVFETINNTLHYVFASAILIFKLCKYAVFTTLRKSFFNFKLSFYGKGSSSQGFKAIFFYQNNSYNFMK